MDYESGLPKENHLVTVLSVACVLGMAVALVVYFLWRSHAGASGSESMFNAVAMLVCPPYVLSFAIGPTPDSDLAMTLVVGTIVFANAALYAGVAAGIYFVVTTLIKKPQPR